ncbi:hypothetical protein BCU68_11235 [Vibrio sp. 10N.286.49.B3]|uniref:peptidoglycan binding protein CsiV n=1 Tax=Vibrio sp. 10N.286.49.B3 TaxID=1880855 RepID=UPI000C850B8E|nr:peptidoglycan binding protein CsiV [Vibrio sp. 10N.286.49.B3]PMH45010.1 hypothetical protein BCU68_11235 [Vibrio sp. 10N.286.49.B3]
MRKLIPLLLLFVSLPSLAQRQFDIEVIVFKRAISPEKVNESWPDDLPTISMTRAGELQDANYRNKKGVELLPKSDYQLTDEIASLQKHAGFKVLLHKAWRQGDEGRSAAPIFHIQAGRDYSTQYNVDGSSKSINRNVTSLDSVDNFNTDSIEEETIDRPLYELDGKLQIYVQHYLYAETTLDLKAPSVRKVMAQIAENDELPLSYDASDESSVFDDSHFDNTVQAGHLESINAQTQTEQYLKSFRMDQKRRMRSTETHYLDNPLMGVIIQVRRVAQD